MCLTETKVFGAPDTLSRAKGPSLLFSEPDITSAQNHGDTADIEVKAYEVSVDTVLGPTESFLSRLALLRTEIDVPAGQMPHRQVQGQAGQCRNKACSHFDRTEGNDSLVLKAWTSNFPVHDWGFRRGAKCLGESMFSRIFKFAFASGVGSCNNAICQRRKAALDASAPTCLWPAFRDYITTLVACWAPIHLLELVFTRMFSDHDSLLFSQNPCVDLQGAVEVFTWARRIVEGVLPRGVFGLQKLIDAISTDKTGKVTRAPAVKQFHAVWRLLSPLHDARGLQYARECQECGLCPTRIWNISMMSPYGVESIFHISNLIISALKADGTSKTQSQHSLCTDQHCSVSIMNSTLAHQAHKCEHENRCQDIYFPPEALNTAFAELPKNPPVTWYNSAWQIHLERIGTTPSSTRIMRLCDESSGGYMAISHVWSDGTGVGMKQPGSVNRCLFEYFRNIAIDLDCTGIWWDTISLPTNRQARNFALSNMLENYERAKVTLIHDQELANFKWREDGSPAVALVLSSWFTRGWTAAELWASRNHAVKVIFAHPNKGAQNRSGQEFVLKDLDQDILGWDLSRREPSKHKPDQWVDVPNDRIHIADFDRPVPVLGHLVATDILTLLRHERRTRNRGPNDLLSDVLQTLRPRITSWSIDQMVIAGLLALPRGEFRAEWSARKITKKILISCGAIRVTDLIHGQVPIRSRRGRWDWCPPSIFDFGLAYGGSDPSDDKCSISGHGTLSGSFIMFETHEDDQILPYGSHPAQRARITTALSDRKHHFMLTTRFLINNLHFILFRPTGMYGTQFIGNWIGCCVMRRPPKTRHPLFPREQTCAFGSLLDPRENMLPALDSRQLLRVYQAFERTSGVTPRLAESSAQSATLNSVPYFPQPIWIFDPHVNSIYYQSDKKGNFRQPPEAFVTGIAVIDRKVKKNQIEQSFASSLPPFVKAEASIHGSVIINLTWSFPHLYRGSWEGCPNTRKIFKSCFEVVPTIDCENEHWDILLGSDSFEEDIGPILSFREVMRSGHDGRRHRWKVLEICHITNCRCDRCIWYDTKAQDLEADIFEEYPGKT